MHILICNPPWYPARGGWGLRAGAEPPRVVDVGDAQVPWPAQLASAAAWLSQHDLGVSLVDSIATRESVGGFTSRIRDLKIDRIAFATSAASLADDLPLLRRVASVRETIVLWPELPAGADRFLELPGVRAVVCGEPEIGLLDAVRRDSPAVYAGEAIGRLDDLPLPYRDYTIHRYRLPLGGLPEGPQLTIRASRGPGRWRSTARILDELAACRREYPRLTHLCLADREINLEPDRFGELARALAALGWPWACRVDAAGPLPPGLETAAALEVTVRGRPNDELVARLRELSDRGVALNLCCSQGMDEEVASALGAAVDAVAEGRLPWPVEPQTAEAAWDATIAAGAVVGAPRGRMLVVGLHQPYYMPPWLADAADELGFQVTCVDCFADPRQVRRLFETTPGDLVLVDRGQALPAELVARVPGRTVLYYPDVLPALGYDVPVARGKYREFLASAPVYDDVILHDSHSLAFVQQQGHRNVRGVVMLPYDPNRHRDLGLQRDIDLLFVGSGSDHRERWIERLRADGVAVEWRSVWGEEFVRLLNRAKIVLNLHYAPQPNTELRIVEALACGCLVVSEPITEPPIFRDGQHLIVIKLETAAETIRYFLAHEAERRAISAAGKAHVAEHHTARHCLEQILALLPEMP